jgi:hypothetical protein
MAHSAFEAATQQFLDDNGLGESTSPEANTPSDAEQEQVSATPGESASQDNLSQEAQNAIWELKETGKFKYQGKEYTAKDFDDLQKGSLRMQDYTKKTQSLSEDRKSFDSERKFYENLHLDLAFVKNNPDSVNQFLQIYPEKFHKYVKDLFYENTPKPDYQQQGESPQAYKPDVELMSRVNKLEKFYTDQEVAKAKSEISKTMEDLSKKYPDALTKVCLSDAYESYSKGVKLTPEVWEEIFKTNDAFMKQRDKQKYGDLVKKQVTANNKAKDVESGGGTPGRAPIKVKRIEEIKDRMMNDLSSR